jgi:phage-related protein
MADSILLETGAAYIQLEGAEVTDILCLDDGEFTPPVGYPDGDDDMAYEVFIIPPSYNLTHEIKLSTVVVDLGDGFEQRVNKNLSWGARGDGLGSASGATYKGINTFRINLQHLRHVDESTTELANVLWAFYVARCGSLYPFYFYNPVEGEIDPTGNEVQGRYLVRFGENILSRENFVWHLYNVGLTLVEVRV